MEQPTVLKKWKAKLSWGLELLSLLGLFLIASFFLPHQTSDRTWLMLVGSDGACSASPAPPVLNGV